MSSNFEKKGLLRSESIRAYPLDFIIPKEVTAVTREEIVRVLGKRGFGQSVVR